MRILSGMQPSGDVHLGNYLGALRQWVDAQGPDAYYCVVDLHALTLEIAPDTLREQTYNLYATMLAVGLDPEICTVFVQSQVPYHSQLSWLLECVATYGELSRMVAFKEKSQRHEGYRVGLLTYPVLMIADILLYEATHVPVGDDQRQHLEITRDIAERFNNRYGQTFTVPSGVQPKVAARVMDLQAPTRKMSKSVSSPLGTIFLFDEAKDIERKIMKAVTDTDGVMRYDWERQPGLANLLEIYASFSGDTPQVIAQRFERYGDFKKDLATLLIESLAPLRQRYLEIRADEEALRTRMAEGASKASQQAGPVYSRAAAAIGLI
ncbi:MAG TPA: tryptophan--tRNA ligase [Acidimicrobiales bacterium]|nr:tryptophan--tRNA ligase [Acidimicrobiales bacterium]